MLAVKFQEAPAPTLDARPSIELRQADCGMVLAHLSIGTILVTDPLNHPEVRISTYSLNPMKITSDEDSTLANPQRLGRVQAMYHKAAPHKWLSLEGCGGIN